MAKSLPRCSDPFSCAFEKSQSWNVHRAVTIPSSAAPRKLQRSKR
ncbi:MAG TPA: hypothetical protein VFA30_02920 [Gaiellaceae bacterium]|nr:hypothetical protein [Gaiellaceae bacterium]